MSLKNLMKTISNKTAGVIITDDSEDAKPTFRGIDYGLTTLQPTQSELKNTLSTIIETILDNEKIGQEELTDQQKKDFILTFYRLTFAQESRAVGCFHPSEISTETTLCERKMYFQKGRVKKDDTYVPFTADNRMQRLCDLGTMKHLYVQENLRRAGILVDLETPVYDEEIGIEGKADGVVQFFGEDDLGIFYDEDMVLEVKTMNSYGHKNLRKPKPEHIRQASIYGGVLKYKRICFLYYNKDTSEHKTFVAPVDYDYFDWFCEIARKVVTLFDTNSRRARSKKVENHDNIPKRICANITNQRASECAYRDFCFKLKN